MKKLFYLIDGTDVNIGARRTGQTRHVENGENG